MEFKGLELYSGKAKKGIWTFALLVGTNRCKESSEILSKGVDKESLKKLLSKLAEGERVIWAAKSGCPLKEILLCFPNQELIEEIQKEAQKQKINLSLFK